MLQDKIRRIIKEEFSKFLLREFMQKHFDWDEFKKLADDDSTYRKAIQYCEECLGEPIGDGSSRIVFEIDDYTVLKIARYRGSLYQNKTEVKNYQQLKHNPLIPKIYGYADDYTWVWCERVLPCDHEDFKKILGITYGNDYEGWPPEEEKMKEVGYDKYTEPQIVDNKGIDFIHLLQLYYKYKDGNDIDDEEAYDVLMKWMKKPWFKYFIELTDYTSQYELFDDNFGIANRNGKPTIVVLDMGIEK